MEERTQAESAYNELSQRILIQEIAPGERIREQLWAERLNVNRAAIRESLTRLHGEGVVRQGGKGGYFVCEMTDDEIHEIREIREILETAAFALACDRATAQEIKGIQEACDDLTSFVKKGYFTGAHEADLRFHQLLVTASNNQRLVQLYHRSHIPLFQRRAARVRNHLKDFVQTDKEHRQILEALKRREKEQGVRFLTEHFRRGETSAVTPTAIRQRSPSGQRPSAASPVAT